MRCHITERELIEYRFKLASEAQSEEIATHLKDCSDCRAALEQLKSRFAALDLLRGEAAVSEDLISRVLEQTCRPAPATHVRLRMPAWIGAAAAVLLMASLLLVSQLRETTQPGREVAREPAAQPAGEAVVEGYYEDGTRGRLTARDEGSEKTDLFATEFGDVGRVNGSGAASVVMDEAAEGEVGWPPFAPASAIELVTLPRRDSVQMTIYNSADLTLIRERRNLTLKKGWNWLQFMWANTLIDPTSLHLEPLESKGQIYTQQLVFPARLRELGRWLIRSEVSGQVPFEITYFTSGLSWRAFYMGTLSADELKMDLKGYVRLANNSGEDYENAQTRLIVGQVHLLDQIAELARRQYPYGMPGLPAPDEADRGTGYGGGRMWTNAYPFSRQWGAYGGYGGGGYSGNGSVDFFALKPKEIKKEGLSEYFLYTIEGRETIPDKWGKRLLSFDVNDIDVNSLYKYDEDRYGRQTIRFISFVNDDEHNLGQTPIPNGDVKIYGLADEQGYLSYVGGTGVKYIPVDEEIELNLGPARLVTVEPTLMDFKTDNYVFDKNSDIAGWDEIRRWKIEITNTRTLPVDIEITRGFGTAYWSLKADIPYEKYDITQRFELTVQPRSKRTFNYTVTTYHGVREEAITE